MSPEALKKKVMKEFKSGGLLKSLDVETSAFKELAPLFEVRHLSMRLVLDDVGAVAAASSIAAEIRRDLEREGIDLEYEICPQWKVVNVSSVAPERRDDADSMPFEQFQAEVQSGNARRSVTIHVSAEAKPRILQFLAHVPRGYRQTAIYRLLETCINHKLSSRAEEYWDPVLYQSRAIEWRDVARIVESRVARNEPQPVGI